MKRIVTVVVLLLFVAAPLMAFNHKAHGEKVGCKACHPEATPAKLTLGGKDPAHKLCQGCHTEKKAGPTKCMECHKKK
jgi:hypothetical protein